MNWFFALLFGLIAGAGGGFFIRLRQDQALLKLAEEEASGLRQNAEQDAERIRKDAENEKQRVVDTEKERLQLELERSRNALDQELNVLRLNAERDLDRERNDARREFDRERGELERDRKGVDESKAENKREREKNEATEERLNRRGEQQDARALKLDEQEKKVNEFDQSLKQFEETLKEKDVEVERQLHETAQLSKDQATEIIFQRLDKELEREKAVRIRAELDKADSEAKRKSYNIIAQSIQRSASEVSAAISVSVVPIPSDAMKGRIIGREGRNIRAFESLTGVDLIIDDTPEAVLLSSFNPIRREVAQLALTELVSDGRIHPARIEEAVQKAQQDMQSYIREKGDEAALEANIVGLKPGMIQLLGRMHFRTSYGQNILKHSVQVAHLTGIIAAELGLDEAMARRAGLLHDIGKSIDREIEGTHTEIGANLGRRFGEPKEVIDAIAHHHDLELAETLYPVLVNAADAISAARPGARRESLESYLKRLEGLENIATSFPGVEKSYAIQAGREIRIIVEPEKVDDASAVHLARDVASRIERDMEYPGQVQVTVVRESRAVEYAR